jgi:hypothetical protein
LGEAVGCRLGRCVKVSAEAQWKVLRARDDIPPGPFGIALHETEATAGVSVWIRDIGWDRRRIRAGLQPVELDKERPKPRANRHIDGWSFGTVHLLGGILDG